MLTIGSLLGMLILDGHVQQSLAALHVFMTVFTVLLMLVYIDLD